MGTPMPPTDLIFDDGEPRRIATRNAMNVLINQSIAADRNDFAGGNMFIYHSASPGIETRDPVVPQTLMVSHPRQGW